MGASALSQPALVVEAAVASHDHGGGPVEGPLAGGAVRVGLVGGVLAWAPGCARAIVQGQEWGVLQVPGQGDIVGADQTKGTPPQGLILLVPKGPRGHAHQCPSRQQAAGAWG